MGIFFTIGENKTRPGVFLRYENVGGQQASGALNGVVAVCVEASVGEVNKVYTFESTEQAYSELGNESTVSVIEEIFKGGASKVYCTRLGKGGTKSSTNLLDSSDKEILKITSKYEKTENLKYTLKESDDLNQKILTIYDENSNIVERIVFPVKGSDFSAKNEADSLLKKALNSKLFKFELIETSNEPLELKEETNFTVSGVAPEPINNNKEIYQEAFKKLEPFKFNTICVDTNDIQIHSLLSDFVSNLYEQGKMCFAVIGRPIGKDDFEQRLQNAKTFNKYNVIFIGDGWINSNGKRIEGFKAAARIAGMVASISSNQSITHKTIADAVDVIELHTNAEYEKAIKSGMMALSLSSNGNVWIDSGITTLNLLENEDDEGWKKIKRTKIRFELMTRANDTVESLIGNINNNEDGRATIIQAVQGLLNTMVSEEKLLNGAKISLDKNNPPQGDSAWFTINADDVDSLEKLYFIFKFQFAPAQA